MLQKLLIAAALVVGATAQANTGGMQSEFFFQTEAGKSDLTPKIGYKSATTKVDGQTDDIEITGLYNTGLSYEYGINEMFAIEGSLNYSSLESNTNPKVKASGLQDPEIALKGTSPMSFGRLRYGAVLGLGFEKAKQGNSTREGKASSGGYSLMPYIGADMDAAGGIVGGRASYEYKMERTVDTGATDDEKRKDGHELGLSAFYEYFFADMLLGGSVNYISEDAVKDSDSGAEVEEAGSKTGVSIYSRMPMGTWDLIPRFDYDFSRSHYSKWNDMTFSVAARFGF